MQFALTHSTPTVPFGLERLFMGDDIGSGFENCRFFPLLLLFFHLQDTEIMSEFHVKTLPVGTTSALVSRTFFRTICCQRVFLTAPRSSMSSLKGSGFVGPCFFFSGRTTVSKSGSGWALNCGTWKVDKRHEIVSHCPFIPKSKRKHILEVTPTSSFRISSSRFSFIALLSRSLSSKENGQTSTWWLSGNSGWNGRPK